MQLSSEELLEKRASLLERLSALPYEGTIEIKESEGRRYIYLRRRVDGRLTSRYVDAYSDEKYRKVQESVTEARTVRKQLRSIESVMKKRGET